MLEMFKNLSIKDFFAKRLEIYEIHSFSDVKLIISKRIVWSVLAQLGNLPIMKMVMFMPFIGTLILFNDKIIGFLSLPLNHFNFLYFGLLFLAFGSFVFSFFCPKEIKQFSDIDTFVSKSENTNGTIFVRMQFQRLITFGEKQDKNDELGADDEVDDEVTEHFYTLIKEIYNEWEYDPEVGDDEDFDPLEIITASNYLDTPKLIKILHDQSPPLRMYWDSFFDKAIEFRSDIARSLYSFLEFESLKARVVVLILYIIGFVLILIPTVIKTYDIVAIIFR